jgi:hypothetical protein
MMYSRILRSRFFLAVIFSIFLIAVSDAGSNDPITGAAYDSLIDAQELVLQQHLETKLPGHKGYQVSGPLDPFFVGMGMTRDLYTSVRVICPDIDMLEKAEGKIKRDRLLKAESLINQIHQGSNDAPEGYRGVLLRVEWQGMSKLVQLNTVNQTRWLIWAHDFLEKGGKKIPIEKFGGYARVVSDHLYTLDRGWDATSEPKAVDHGLPAKLDIYLQPPDYVIAGYDNYKAYLKQHAGISTDFARGILSFVPTDSLLDVLKSGAPSAAYPNKEAPMLQHEYLKFFTRKGDVTTMKTLTAELFKSLVEGEYFFAVGLSGRIRFGRELLREEVEKIEAETGQKVPRPNHAFLFPGEPVLTAGAFFIERDSVAHLIEVNAQSGHYFYSNISSSIREDISIRSNEYLLTLGHFFRALDRLKIPYELLLISKL